MRRIWTTMKIVSSSMSAVGTFGQRSRRTFGCWWLLLLLKEVSCFELELKTELFSWRGAVLKPACWKGVPTLRTSSSTFSSAKLDNCCLVSRFIVEFCSALEKLTVVPRCSDLNSPDWRFLMAASKPIGITLIAPARSFPRICPGFEGSMMVGYLVFLPLCLH